MRRKQVRSLSPVLFAGEAQLAERLTLNQQEAGSIPVARTVLVKDLSMAWKPKKRTVARNAGAEALRQKFLLFEAEYAANPKRCRQCKTSITYASRRNAFCSHSCAALFNNLAKGLRIRSIKSHPCAGCQQVITTAFCCSRKCFQQGRYNVYIREWLAGIRDATTCGGQSVSTHVKRWLRERCGDKCEMCGWQEKNPVTQKVPLQVDHKDGNALNSQESNLRLLCPNCHSLTPNYGGLNRGRGRKNRRR